MAGWEVARLQGCRVARFELFDIGGMMPPKGHKSVCVAIEWDG